jgi:hypothetical protein
MVTEPAQPADFPGALAHRAAWRLLVKGLEAFLPERAAALRLADVRPVSQPLVAVETPLVFLSEETGFGLHLSGRSGGHEPEREIFVRGREGRAVGSIGIVIIGSSPRVGTRVLDAPRLLRYARSLTFGTLFEPADSGSVVAAVQAARAVENVVFIDLSLGIGLCAELDPATRKVGCPLLARFGPRSSITVLAHAPLATAVPA